MTESAESTGLVERSFFNADDLSLLIMEHPDAPQFLAVKIADEHDAAIRALEAEVARLREALRPFAAKTKTSSLTEEAMIRRARAALAGDAP